MRVTEERKLGLFGTLSSSPPIIAMSCPGRYTAAEKALKGALTSVAWLIQKSFVTSYSAILLVSHLAIFIFLRNVDYNCTPGILSRNVDCIFMRPDSPNIFC